MNARDVTTLLATRHPAPAWVFLTEVRTQTGWLGGKNAAAGERYLDAFAMHLWPSKGYRRVAYEVKVSRSDWLQELADSGKNAQALLLAHEFWFALGPGVFRDEDWPKHFHRLRGCGILLVNEAGEFDEVQRPSKGEPWPMPEAFIASLLRNAARLPADGCDIAQAHEPMREALDLLHAALVQLNRHHTDEHHQGHLDELDADVAAALLAYRRVTREQHQPRLLEVCRG